MRPFAAEARTAVPNGLPATAASSVALRTYRHRARQGSRPPPPSRRLATCCASPQPEVRSACRSSSRPELAGSATSGDRSASGSSAGRRCGARPCRSAGPAARLEHDRHLVRGDVVVAEGDLVGGGRVRLVDDRTTFDGEQPRECSAALVQVVGALLEVGATVSRHLRRVDAPTTSRRCWYARTRLPWPHSADACSSVDRLAPRPQLHGPAPTAPIAPEVTMIDVLAPASGAERPARTTPSSTLRAERPVLAGDDGGAEFRRRPASADRVSRVSQSEARPAAKGSSVSPYAAVVSEFETVRVAAVQATPVILDAEASGGEAVVYGSHRADGAQARGSLQVARCPSIRSVRGRAPPRTSEASVIWSSSANSSRSRGL